MVSAPPGGQRDVTLICFTGYRLAGLRRSRRSPGVAGLLAETDVLIDGRYVAARNDNRGLRGSDNQRVHHLTGRRWPVAYSGSGRRPGRTEIQAPRHRSALLVGVPDHGAAGAFDPAARPVPPRRPRR